MIYGWSPGIGDPSFLGWFTVVAYLVAAILCIRASRNDAGARRFWRILAFAMVVLGVNKQLDIQSLLTAVGREFANSAGWYDRRREFQAFFVFVIGLFAIIGAIAALVIPRHRSHQVRGALAGFVLLAAFICIRAASFHHVDRFLNAGILGARFNWIIELGGILLIALNALSAKRATASNAHVGEGAK